jgi:hypothetical protein
MYDMAKKKRNVGYFDSQTSAAAALISRGQKRKIKLDKFSLVWVKAS